MQDIPIENIDLIADIHLLADIVLFGSFIIVILVGLWSLGATVPKALYLKYPRRLIFMSQLPIAYSWRTQVTVEDMLALDKARFRSQWLTLATFLLTHAIVFYKYAHIVAELHNCMVKSIGFTH